MLQKGFSKVLVIVIVLVVIGGGVLAWQWPENQLDKLDETTQPIVEEDNQPPVEIEPPIVEDETVDWKTITNINGFIIKYPMDMKVLGAGIDVDESTAPILLVFKDFQTHRPSFLIDVTPRSIYEDVKQDRQ